MKKYLIPLFIFIFLLIGTTLVILYGKGYRFGFNDGKPGISGTGLLVATSVPDGAQVFINDHLTTATDNTINLSPGTYKVKIAKEGYFSWEKELVVKEEVVTKAEALLFPTTPKLEGITNTGVSNPAIDPSFTKIAYIVASQSAATKRGIFVLDMSSRPILTLQSASAQIADDTIYNFSQARPDWSPDGSQIIATTSGNFPTTFLLQARGFNQSPIDVSETILSVTSEWEKEQNDKEEARLNTVKDKLRKVIANNFEVISWSPDETKILYKARNTATLDLIITPRLIGVNSIPEERTLEKDSVYVYDIKEDRNYKIIEDSSSSLKWFPDSRHLIHVHDQKVDIMEYDATNVTTVYAGPFEDSYVFPWPDGTKLVILTNLGNPNITPNLYTISLK